MRDLRTRMRGTRFLRVGAAIAVVALVSAVGVGTAAADGRGTQTTHFKVQYTDGLTNWNCAGVRLVKKGSSVSDSETCRVTGTGVSAFVAGTYASDSTVDLSGETSFPIQGAPACGRVTNGIPGSGLVPIPGVQGSFWFSDYEGVFVQPSSFRCAESFTLKFVNMDGGVWTVAIDASYAP
jgi:hypothetical protein